MHRDANRYDGHPTTRRTSVQLRQIEKEMPLRVLSQSDWVHWVTQGYVIVRGAARKENVERLTQLLWEFDEKNPNDPTTWLGPDRRPHRMKELNSTGLLEIYNHQLLWDNRQEERVYNAFVDVWDREDLWVVIDRANLNPPRPDHPSPEGFIHWDADTSQIPLPIGVQGVLSLSRQDEEIGGFQCVPELFRQLDDWLKAQPNDRDPLRPDTRGFEIVVPELDAGDLLIFNALLPHGVRPNRSRDRVRMAQYISMYPAEEHSEAERQERIRIWRERGKPSSGAFPGDPRGWEKRNAATAQLTSLGRRLLGLDLWS